MKPLSDVERSVVQHVISGFADKETARKMGISHRTIQCHRLNIKKRLRVASKRELFLKARELGIEFIW